MSQLHGTSLEENFHLDQVNVKCPRTKSYWMINAANLIIRFVLNWMGRFGKN